MKLFALKKGLYKIFQLLLIKKTVIGLVGKQENYLVKYQQKYITKF